MAVLLKRCEEYIKKKVAGGGLHSSFASGCFYLTIVRNHKFVEIRFWTTTKRTNETYNHCHGIVLIIKFTARK